MPRRLPTLAALACLALLPALPGRADDPKQTEADEQRLKTAGVASDDKALFEFVRARTLTDTERAKVELLITQLGAVSFRTREQAAADLVAKGAVIIELLKQHLNSPDPEISRRCETCLQKIKQHDHPPEVAAAVLRLLAARKPAGAAEAVLAYLPFADHEDIAAEARTTLTALAVEGGKANKVVVQALADKDAIRRAAAGEALVKAGVADAKDEARALLRDASALVRWRVATALVLAGDRLAMPTLIDTLPELTQTQAWQTEDVLVRLADGKGPGVALGTDEAGRKVARDAWQKWWTQHGAKADLALLQQTPRLLGYTTIVLLDLGRVLEIDGSDNVRWQLDMLDFPLDVQVLPGDRVLVAEYHGGRVTERNFKGEILWQRAFDGPQMAQRLPNGNTFIAGKYSLIEVDRNGKQVMAISLNGAHGIMKCMKRADGEIVCLFDDARVAVLDSNGKELSSFRVNLEAKLSGGRLYVLPNGNVLVPHHAENKVVEYDPTGKELWKVKIDQPIAAVRLANGNTLVTSMNQNRAVEFDRDGKEVWQYRGANTRVTRALRR
jgi:HEAT repeat protein